VCSSDLEIYDYLRLLWARIGKPHCYNCGRPIAAQSAEQIIDQIMGMEEGTRFMVLAPIVRGRKGEYGKQLEELRAEGFTRAKVDGELWLLEAQIVGRRGRRASRARRWPASCSCSRRRSSSTRSSSTTSRSWWTGCR